MFWRIYIFVHVFQQTYKKSVRFMVTDKLSLACLNGISDLLTHSHLSIYPTVVDICLFVYVFLYSFIMD